METPQISVVVPTRDDYYGCWNTICSLIDHHDEHVLEIIVVDNSPPGSEHAKLLKAAADQIEKVRYDRITGPESSCLYKQRGIQQATGEFVLVCDSHVLFPTQPVDSIAALVEYFAQNPNTNDLIMGPICNVAGRIMATNQALYEWEQIVPSDADIQHGVVARGGALGAWVNDPRGHDPNGPAFEIQQNGTGAFAFRRATWPTWPTTFRGHGGNETFVMEAYRQAGGRVLCLPGFRWTHNFGRVPIYTDKQGRATSVPYDMVWEPRVANYLNGFALLDLPQLYDAAAAHLANFCPQTTEAQKRKFPRPPGNFDKLFGIWKQAGGDAGGAVPKLLFHEIRKRIRPGMFTLEFGSGLSTLLFDAIGTDHVAIEHDRRWLDRLQPLLKRETTQLVESPISNDSADPWFAWRPDGVRQADLVLIDGPPGHIGRSGCRHYLGDILAPAATVILDDTHRPAEQELSDLLAEMYGFTARRFHAGGRAFDVLMRVADESAYQAGAGAELKRIIKTRFGIDPAANCGCNGKAREMNYRGLDWCAAHVDLIVEWMKEGAAKWSVDQGGIVRTWLAIVPDFAKSAFIAGLIREAIAAARKIEAGEAAEPVSQMTTTPALTS